MKLVLDTNRYTDLMNGVPEVIVTLERANAIYLPFITIAELRAGFAMGTKGQANELALSRFMVKPEVTRENDFTDAGRVLAAVLYHATHANDRALTSRTQAGIKDLNAAQVVWEAWQLNIGRLKTAPEDPAANFAVGSYLCFAKGQWAQGLPYLMRGDNAAVKSAAVAEKALPADATAEAITGVADAWWDLAAQQATGSSPRIFQHAGALYERAASNLGGLRLSVVQKRLAAAVGPIESEPGESGAVSMAQQRQPLSLDYVNGNPAGWEFHDAVVGGQLRRRHTDHFVTLPPGLQDAKYVRKNNEAWLAPNSISVSRNCTVYVGILSVDNKKPVLSAEEIAKVEAMGWKPLESAVISASKNGNTQEWKLWREKELTLKGPVNLLAPSLDKKTAFIFFFQ